MEKRVEFERLRCPRCGRRLADVSGKDYAVLLWCRSCKSQVVFQSRVQK